MQHLYEDPPDITEVSGLTRIMLNWREMMAMICDGSTRAGYDAAREYLIRSPIATYYFHCVECKEVPNIYLRLRDKVTIRQGFKFDEKTSEIWWDPGSGAFWEKGAASPALVLLHEIIHACRHYMLGVEPGPSEEIFAVNVCNEVAELVGEDFRPVGNLGAVFPAKWNGVTHSDRMDIDSTFIGFSKSKKSIKIFMKPEWIRFLKGKPGWEILSSYPDNKK